MFKSDRTAHSSAKRVRSNSRNSFVFCDKKTGGIRYTVDADQNGNVPLDRVAGSLAVYCITHYCSPRDLVLVVCADEALNENINSRATALLETARVGSSAVALTPRQREVLRGVTENLGNKEIASQLSISERTVKYHVSHLLSMFGVFSRSQLSDFTTARVYDQSKIRGDVKNTSDARSTNSGRSAGSINKNLSYFPNRSAAAYS